LIEPYSHNQTDKEKMLPESHCLILMLLACPD
jgi:hypothetical protein